MSKKKIAFQGEPGANSHLAITEAYPGATAIPCATFEDAFAAVRNGRAELAMIPIENSIAGRVADIHHLMPSLRMTLRHWPSAWTWLSTVLSVFRLAPFKARS